VEKTRIQFWEPNFIPESTRKEGKDRLKKRTRKQEGGGKGDEGSRSRHFASREKGRSEKKEPDRGEELPNGGYLETEKNILF